MAAGPRGLVPALIARFAGRLRFPQLFAITGLLFLLDLLFPDFIPLVDEMILGLLTLLLGVWKRDEKVVEPEAERTIKDVTPD